MDLRFIYHIICVYEINVHIFTHAICIFHIYGLHILHVTYTVCYTYICAMHIVGLHILSIHYAYKGFSGGDSFMM